MACGVPTIASNVPGLNSVVLDGGILFEKGNLEDLRDKILMLEESSIYQEISKMGKNKANTYDISTSILKIEEMYNEII